MAKLFSMDPEKDKKLIMNHWYTWNVDGKQWKVRLKTITLDGYYEFIVRAYNDCEWECFMTREPNSGDITE